MKIQCKKKINVLDQNFLILLKNLVKGILKTKQSKTHKKIVKWFKKFHRDRSCLLDRTHRKTLSAVFQTMTARLTFEFFEQKHIIVIEHTVYSPDLAMCDF